MALKNNYSIKDHWSQTTITDVTMMKKFKILWELPKCDRNTKWTIAVWKMALIDTLEAELPQTKKVCKENTLWDGMGTEEGWVQGG